MTETGTIERHRAGNVEREISGQQTVAHLDGKCKEKIPTDRYNMVYLIFYLLGCGTLLPWNFFITANTYFKLKLNTELDLQEKFQNYFSIASMGPNLLVMIANVFLLHRINHYTRMVTSLAVMILMFGLTSVMVLLNSEEWSRTFFLITMTKMVMINASSSVFQGALFGMCGQFPLKYIQGMMAGQGLGGIVATGASIISALAGDDVIKSAFGYFCTATVALMVSLVGYVILERTDFVKYHTGKLKTCFCTCNCSGARLLSNTKECMSNDETKQGFQDTKESQKHLYLIVFRQVLPMSCSAFLIFFGTLAIFPSTTAKIQSMSTDQNAWTDKYFTPVTCFLSFNVFDYIGKSLAGAFRWPTSKGYWLVVLCACRLVFLPLFALCNVQPRDDQSLFLLKNDAYPIVLMIVFGLTNGYLSSLAVMYAPKLVDRKNAELAGTIMAFSIVAGLASGAFLSFAIAPNL